VEDVGLKGLQIVFYHHKKKLKKIMFHGLQVKVIIKAIKFFF
jgi:hypothetical protein